MQCFELCGPISDVSETGLLLTSEILGVQEIRIKERFTKLSQTSLRVLYFV